MTLTDIVQQWPAFQKLDTTTRQLLLERMAICDGCSYKKQLNVEGSLLSADRPNLESSVYYCGMCGCSLFNKAKDPDNNCPISKWPQIEEPEESYY